jgi:hypothetical protein
VNYSGINICGSFNTRSYAKFISGTVSNNTIYLENGLVGIKVGRNDSIEVINNKISGKSYYGIKVHGKGQPGDRIIYAEDNKIQKNSLVDLEIKPPDDFSNSNADGITFAETDESSITSHIWLDSYTKNNIVSLKDSVTIIDEGENNKIIR